MAICGSCYTRSTFDMAESYYFTYFSDIWGWATWRRAWQLYDRDLSRWPKYKQARGFRSVFKGDASRESSWSQYFDRTAAGEIDTWDYQWIYTVIEQGGLACYPTRNLVSNLGWHADATHTKVAIGAEPGPLACQPHQPFRFPLRHPRLVARSEHLESRLCWCWCRRRVSSRSRPWSRIATLASCVRAKTPRSRSIPSPSRAMVSCTARC
jgi:hypothetical protein